MGAVRITGENGTTIAGVTSGDQSSSARVPYPATVVTILRGRKGWRTQRRVRARGRVVDAEAGFSHRGRRGPGIFTFVTGEVF
jgi:hypothetical protein